MRIWAGFGIWKVRGFEKTKGKTWRSDYFSQCLRFIERECIHRSQEGDNFTQTGYSVMFHCRSCRQPIKNKRTSAAPAPCYVCDKVSGINWQFCCCSGLEMSRACNWSFPLKRTKESLQHAGEGKENPPPPNNFKFQNRKLWSLRNDTETKVFCVITWCHICL